MRAAVTSNSDRDGPGLADSGASARHIGHLRDRLRQMSVHDPQNRCPHPAGKPLVNLVSKQIAHSSSSVDQSASSSVSSVPSAIPASFVSSADFWPSAPSVTSTLSADAADSAFASSAGGACCDAAPAAKSMGQLGEQIDKCVCRIRSGSFHSRRRRGRRRRIGRGCRRRGGRCCWVLHVVCSSKTTTDAGIFTICSYEKGLPNFAAQGIASLVVVLHGIASREPSAPSTNLRLSDHICCRCECVREPTSF